MRRDLVLVLGLVVLFLGLRLPGLDSRLPHAPEPDGKLVHQASIEAERGKYPFIWVSALSASGQMDPRPLDGAASVEERLADARRPFRTGRLLVLLACAAGLVATWALGRRLLSPRAALFAAALVAVGPVWTLYGMQARPHALAAGISACAVVACAGLVQRPTLLRHVVAAGTVALACSTFHTGLFTLVPYLLALVCVRPSGRSLAVTLVGVTAAASLSLWSYASDPELDITPGLSRTEKRYGEQVAVERADETFRISGHAIYPELIDGGGLEPLGELLRSCDPVLGVLAPLGLLLAFASMVRPGRRTRASAPEIATILSFPAATLIVLGAYSGSLERFFVPLFPFLALAAARAMQPLLERSRALAIGSSMLVLALPLATSARLTYLRMQPDSAEVMADWIGSNLETDAGPILSLTLEDLPLLTRDVPKRVRKDAVSWRNHQAAHAAPTGDQPVYDFSLLHWRFPARVSRSDKPGRTAKEILDEHRPRYAILSVDGIRTERWVDRDPPTRFERAVTARDGRLLFRVDPVREDAKGRRGVSTYLGRSAIRNLWSVDRLGPPLELWELDAYTQDER